MYHLQNKKKKIKEKKNSVVSMVNIVKDGLKS